jgi:hypothetical protein
VYSRVLVIAFTFAALVSCATPDDAAVGMSAEEIRVLVSEYYWHRGTPPPHYSSEQLDSLLRASADPTLDGAQAEQQASRVAVALAVVGDEKFSQVLARQPSKVKRAVAYEIRYMWINGGLHYPRTEALLGPYT